MAAWWPVPRPTDDSAAQMSPKSAASSTLGTNECASRVGSSADGSGGDARYFHAATLARVPASGPSLYVARCAGLAPRTRL